MPADIATSCAARSTPPGLEGPSPVIVAATYCNRPPSPLERHNSHPEQTGPREGQGVGGGCCAVCAKPLGRGSDRMPLKRYCSASCRLAAAAERAGRRCEQCGGALHSPVNRFCTQICAIAWRRGAGFTLSDKQRAQIASLWAAGLSQVKIALRVGVTKHAVAGYRRRHMPARDNPKGQKAPPPATPAKAARTRLICQPETADRRQPGRYCSAHPEIRFHPKGWSCRAAAA